MSKEEEIFQIQENNPQIGTEILDNALPSSIDFDSEQKNKSKLSKQQYEGKEISKDAEYTIKNKKSLPGDSIRTYAISGKVKLDKDPKYNSGSVLKDGNLHTYEVRAFDEQKNGGLKFIWQSLFGYVKRELLFDEGYFYILQRTKEGYFAHGVFPLIQLFRIFADNEQNKIRLVFRNPEDKKLIEKNYEVKSCEDIVDKISEELGQLGLLIIDSQ